MGEILILLAIIFGLSSCLNNDNKETENDDE